MKNAHFKNKTIKAIILFLINVTFAKHIHMSLYCLFSSHYTIQIAPFLLMCCHINVNKYDLWEFAVMNPNIRARSQ